MFEVLRNSVEKAKIGHTGKQKAIKNLTLVAQLMEENFNPTEDVNKVIAKERADSYKHGGRTVYGKEKPPDGKQLKLFE